MNCRRRYRRRSGNVLVLAAFLMIILVATLAFTIDLGYIYVAGAQLQRSADSAAMAAAWDLIDEDALAGNGNPVQRDNVALATAAQYAGLNPVASSAPALAGADVEIGYLNDPLDPHAQLTFDDPNIFNAVRVRVRRTVDQNGEVNLFFARVLGIDTAAQQAEATAMFYNNLKGIQTPSNGECVNFLPLALDEQSWINRDVAGTDNWTWDTNSRQVRPWGGDGIHELNLYPEGVGAPGNRGTVDVGSNNNSTADISRQILWGITPADLAFHGGKLELDVNGQLLLNGDTGLSAGIKDELTAIIGRPTVIPLFSQVTGNGNNAYYTIVGFAGVRILEVRLTGNDKRVTIQAANTFILGGVPVTDGSGQRSTFVYSPVWLVR